MRKTMKMTVKNTMCLSAVITALVSGCQVAVTPGGVVATAPVPTVEVAAPSVEIAPPSYVWDGFEFVGEYNGGFVYLGPGGAWVAASPFILDRFHGWERGHPDWRRSAIRYDRNHRPDPRRRGREEKR
jgi:hypothetical protein